ncbi:MAG: hypothetical protein ORN49_02240 [Rhodobacteraceae bacterium]|nr:hypothetical protein [Paracoccaceae bacterium]
MALRPDHLFDAADVLAKASTKQPREVFLWRAVSKTYYAMSHRLAQHCADLIIGTNGATRSKPA